MRNVRQVQTQFCESLASSLLPCLEDSQDDSSRHILCSQFLLHRSTMIYVAVSVDSHFVGVCYYHFSESNLGLTLQDLHFWAKGKGGGKGKKGNHCEGQAEEPATPATEVTAATGTPNQSWSQHLTFLRSLS